jgi:tetratricopeptide (TPR) repeat protein
MVSHARRRTADDAQALTGGAMVPSRVQDVPAVRVILALAIAGLAAVSGATAQVGGAEAESAFAEGLAALHSFEYEDANAAFLRAQRADPGFALAYWGEAMTYHQTLWGHEDVAAGRRALARLPATARAAAAGSRARGLLNAARVLFGDGEGTTRRQRYADAMATAHAADSRDPDVASLYALALLGTTSRSLIGTGDHEGHSAGLAGSATQARVGEILGAVLKAHPEHPGALHYLLHNYDDPGHAVRGLEAARAYATVAPQSSHALHMPAHIFLQLGRWADAEASDRAAFAASDAWVKRKGLPPALRSYHALAWRQYELLQLGRYRDAALLIDEIGPVVDATGDRALVSDLASMRARQILETRRWEALANERDFGNVNELCAIGFSAARSGNPGLAELARAGLAARATAPEEGDLRPAIAIMEREVAALMALASGRGAEAVDILTAATRAELALPAPLGLPIPVIPAPELLGEVLLELDRPAEARQAFAQALARNANRTRSVLGSARAAARLGQRDLARTHYANVLANYEHADSVLPEITEARTALATAAATPVRTPPRSGWPLLPIAAAIVGLAGGLAAVRYWKVRARAQVVSAPPPYRADRRRAKRGRK